MKIIFDSESIFYRHIVVGGVVNCIKYIYGGRTSLFLTSQRMPSRYVLRLQVYRTVEFIGVENICVWYFWGDILYKHSVVGDNTYFIYTKMGGADVIALTRTF